MATVKGKKFTSKAGQMPMSPGRADGELAGGDADANEAIAYHGHEKKCWKSLAAGSRGFLVLSCDCSVGESCWERAWFWCVLPEIAIAGTKRWRW